MKVFLSHSSRNKDFVDVVARKLGRNQVVYDRYNFEPGHDFISEIELRLGDATHFVLFASRASLASDWVRFELDELRYHNILKGIPFLVLIIDRDVSLDELPPWMTRGKVEATANGDLAFRAIEMFCAAATSSERKLFMGREELLSDFSYNLTKEADADGRRIFAFTGLGGIGRRTFAGHAIQSYLGQQVQVLATLGHHDSLVDLYVKLLQLANGDITVTSLEAQLRDFRDANEGEQAAEVARLLNEYSKLNFAPCIVDNGAMLDAAGRYVPWAQSLLEACNLRADLTLVLIHGRRPQYVPDDKLAQKVLITSVPALSEQATRRLLRTLLLNAKTPSEPEERNELSPYLDGYPPATIWATELAQRYGIKGLLADKSVLIDIKIRTLSRLLERLQLTTEDWKILRILAGQPLLPIDAISVAASIDPSICITSIRKLVDCHLVEPVSQGLTIARPIRDAVGRTKGLLQAADFAKIAKALCSHYWEDDSGPINVDILSATIHAVTRAGAEIPENIKNLVLPSSLHSAAESAYHSKDWVAARRIAEQAIIMDTTHIPSLITLFKALVRLGEFSEADKCFASLEDLKPRELHYLHGFLEWKRNNLPDAIRFFKRSIAVGYSTVPVCRDLAHCLYFSGEHSEALKYVSLAYKASRVPNRFVVDLAAKIAIDSGEYTDAEEYIEQLRLIDTLQNVQHREASLRAKQNKWHEVLRLTADVQVDGARSETIALRISALIEMQDFGVAEELLSSFEKKCSSGRKDVCNGLWCKLRMRQNRWTEAEGYWRQLEDKETEVYRACRAAILKHIIEDPDTSLSQRQQAKEELQCEYAVE